MDGSTGWGAGGRGMARLFIALLSALAALLVLGGVMRTAGLAAAPLVDDAPAVLEVFPPPNAQRVPLDAATDGSLAVTFSEPVTLTNDALQLVCGRSQVHSLTIQGGPVTYSFSSDQPFLPGERCDPILFSAGVSDHDADDPPDLMQLDYTWAFRTAAEPILINEIDAITADGTTDFIELYDGGQLNTDLSGLTLVFFRGDEASVYLAVGLDGYRTDEEGYFVIGAAGTPQVDLLLAVDGLRNGPDAVAVYNAPESEFPRNAPVSTENLVDAVVYGPASADLLALLHDGQEPLDENSRGAASSDSSQRCLNGAGRPRETEDFRQNTPSAGQENNCHIDSPPEVIAMSPAHEAADVALDTSLEVTFSEPVIPSATPLRLECMLSGPHTYTMTGDGVSYQFTPDEPLAKGERCDATVMADAIRDADEDDPPDQMRLNFSWHFTTSYPVAEGIIINEIDADTPSVDTAEFIELYDGGAGHTSLDGLAVVLFNGADDSSYLTFDLDGYATNAAGYFVLGNAAVSAAGATFPDGALQNGPDAAVLVAGGEDDYPHGTPVTATVPLDAIVYSRPEDNDPGLHLLLPAKQPQVDENGRGQADAHSNQRCPNGAGGPLNTAAYKQNTPTPGAINDCITDFPPEVIDMNPGRGATGVGIDTLMMVEFNEPVEVKKKWLTLECDLSGKHTVITTGGPTTYTIAPVEPLAHAEACTVTVVAHYVTDRDLDDPPDGMTNKKSWSFTTAAAPPDFVLINEIDPDTPSSDTAEFIELYDGGVGHTALDGLTLVFFNGSSDLSYRAIDLDGLATDARGYLLVGNAGVDPDVVMADGALQNGPDAVALYAADAAQFPINSTIRQPGLLDAIVYGEAATPQLLALLAAGQPAVDEDGRGAADLHSLQRCPNGAGGRRETTTYLPNTPTPGEASECTIDGPPLVAAVTPQNGEADVSVNSGLTVAFSEPVTLLADAVSLTCAAGGPRALAVTGGPQSFTLTPAAPLLQLDQCQAQLAAARVSDIDSVDPPDHPAQDYSWSFTTGRPPADYILINEVDADTPGSDVAEFIELSDGGRGHTDLAGLVLVLFNGSDDRSYLAVDLMEAYTDSAGYLVVGNSDVAGSSVALPSGILQNGADAVALYAGRAADFSNGTALHTRGLLDAVVYGTDDPADSGLLALLLNGDAQLNEAGRGAADQFSSGRCPDGAGGQRRSVAFRQNMPSPGAPNTCSADAPPAIVDITPIDGAMDVALDAALGIAFTEDVQTDPGWFAITCEASGEHAAAVGGGPRQFTITPTAPFAPRETCEVVLTAAAIHDLDGDDPPDQPAADFDWSFTTGSPPADFVLINEIDANTPGSDKAEFIELFDGGIGNIDLSGLVVVFWNGSDDLAYRAMDLDGYHTDAGGYLLLGNAAVAGADVVFANGALQNGPDAVALLIGSAADFPSGSPLPANRVLDAVVYGPAESPDATLLALLESGQLQIDEAAGGAAETNSLQRCPDGAGGQRRTDGYRASAPTPSASNRCPNDEPPTVVAVTPADGATGVSPDATLTVRFSENVAPTAQWFTITCTTGGHHIAAVAGGPREFTLTPNVPFVGNDACAVTITASSIHDADADDPPDIMAADYRWSFHVAGQSTTSVLINEIDPDTPGVDRAEFIELFDGGSGHTPLDGLVIVLWNGKDDQAYRAFDLAGHQTDAAGFFLLGNAGLESGLELPGGALQNGPDAIALYAGRAADFPAGTALTTTGLLDAIVYGPAGAPDAQLLALLEPDEPQADEAGRGAAEDDSLQRCPDAAAGPRRTIAYHAATPTPGRPNACPPPDQPPAVLDVSPAAGATGVAARATLHVTFDEDVTVDPGWLALACDPSGPIDLITSGGPRAYTLTPSAPFAPGESCVARLSAAAVHDADTADPPDSPAADLEWRFTVSPVVIEPPQPGFTTNGPLWIGEIALFTNTTTGDGPLRYVWDFGDGHPPATVAQPSHRYAAPGHYTVTLTASNDAGTSTVTAVIEVRPRQLYWPIILSDE